MIRLGEHDEQQDHDRGNEPINRGAAVVAATAAIRSATDRSAQAVNNAAGTAGSWLSRDAIPPASVRATRCVAKTTSTRTPDVRVRQNATSSAIDVTVSQPPTYHQIAGVQSGIRPEGQYSVHDFMGPFEADDRDDIPRETSQ